ncbi:unnamed protein product [Phytophthora fragariaefolia]|uniref:Unnamed protein product n=1 Tax=Phytophthora fragariaefolia TaxID=1490495 RepID=A0A9W6XDE1_9STRA|nr:unnamed protein product [Phytophthora fragariaefolia]
MAQAVPPSPKSDIQVSAKPRRSSVGAPPPKSDIQVSAFAEGLPRRRGAAAQDQPPRAAPQEEQAAAAAAARGAAQDAAHGTDADAQVAESDDAAAAEQEAARLETERREAAKQEAARREAEAAKQEAARQEAERQEAVRQETAKLEAIKQEIARLEAAKRALVEAVAPEAAPAPLPPVGPKPEDSGSSDDDPGETSAYGTDESLDEVSDFDTDSEDLSSGYSIFNASMVEVGSDTSDEETTPETATTSNQDSEDEGQDVPSAPASELPTVKEEDEEDQQPVSRLSAKDLAFMALGRVSSSTFSDVGSPVSSTYEKKSPKPKPAPMSYTPASSAFPPSRLGRSPVPATTGRTRHSSRLPPSSSTSVSSYVRRSRSRAPMDLKNQLPPSIGVLSGLSSGSSTFAMDPSCFYEVVWKSGEFAFSVQRVYTEENEFEFDDRNQEPQLFLRMLLNTERSTCKSFRDVRLGDVLIRVGDSYVSDLGLEGSGTVLTKFFAKLTAQTPIRLTFQRMFPGDWEGGVEL